MDRHRASDLPAGQRPEGQRQHVGRSHGLVLAAESSVRFSKLLHVLQWAADHEESLFGS